MSTQYGDNARAAATIASAIQEAVSDLVCAMPSGCEPYDYSLEFRSISKELSDIAGQIARIADVLEAKEAA